MHATAALAGRPQVSHCSGRQHVVSLGGAPIRLTTSDEDGPSVSLVTTRSRQADTGTDRILRPCLCVGGRACVESNDKWSACVCERCCHARRVRAHHGTHSTDQVGRQFTRWPDWASGRETCTLANCSTILEVEESL